MSMSFTAPPRKQFHAFSRGSFSGIMIPFPLVLGGSLLLMACLLLLGGNSISHNLKTSGVTTQHKFRGQQYWKPGVTQSVRTLYETAFSRFQIHTVLLPDGKTVVDDWMWFDEVDHINLLIELESDNNDNTHQQSSPRYLIFKQTKYAIPGESYAVLGGLMEPGETPLQAAQRELQEELHMTSEDWHSLGSYRVAVNRGGGTTHVFLARKAKQQVDTNAAVEEVKGQADLERQDMLLVSHDELLEALLEGKFQEIKWTATVALALLKMQHEEKQQQQQ